MKTEKPDTEEVEIEVLEQDFEKLKKTGCLKIEGAVFFRQDVVLSVIKDDRKEMKRLREENSRLEKEVETLRAENVKMIEELQRHDDLNYR